jgi:hypothetical protein
VIVGQEAVISHDGWPGEEESEYVSIEPSTLVWELARKVNLHRTEKPEEGAPEVRVETTMGALDAAFVALEGTGADDDTTRDLVRKALVEADTNLTDPAVGQFLDLVVSLNATWRITTAWESAPPRSAPWPPGTWVRRWGAGTHIRALPAAPVRAAEGQSSARCRGRWVA